MVIPRYWSSDAAYRIDDVISIAQEAETFALNNYEAEMIYYQAVCESSYGELDSSGSQD